MSDMTDAASGYCPPLRVREIPFDLRSAIALEDVSGMVRDFGRATVIDFVALNLVAEFGETLLFYLNRTYGVMAKPGEDRSFVHQEVRHAMALHVVNRRFVGETYVKSEFGRISTICEAARAPLLLRLRAAGDEEERDAVLREMSLELAAFETTYGLLAQVPQFQLLQHQPELFLAYPAFSYVMLYHAAEEAEHTHVSWRHHRDIHGVDIFDAEQRPALVGAMQRVFDDTVRVMFLTAQAMRLPLSLAEVEDLAAVRGRKRLLEDIAAGKFHPDKYSDLRRQAVTAWDSKWEPQFRAEVQTRLQG